MTERAMISLEDVRKSYRGFELGPINLEIEPGSIVAVVGPNGAGKSTLFGILMNIIKPDSGHVSLFGLSHPRQEVEIKRKIGYVPEHATGHDDLSANTLGEFVSHWYPHWNQELYQELLVRYGVDPNKRFDRLSKGDQRRLSFALALAEGTELLLLDEPTAGVDPVGQNEMLEDISRFVRHGAGVKTVVFATHVMEEARRIADHVTPSLERKVPGPVRKAHPPQRVEEILGRQGAGSRPPRRRRGRGRESYAHHYPTRPRRPHKRFPRKTYRSSTKDQ